MKSIIDIVLGSTSIHKIEAVKQACLGLGLNADISGVKASSGQNEQPVGFEETFSGALARASYAKSTRPDCFAIGIESGIFRFGMTFDIAVIVILTPDNRQIVTISEGIPYPTQYVEIAEERGFKTTTVSSIIAQQIGGDPTNPHSTLTSGKVTRTMLLTSALITALRQL